ncbi:hypothetical protein [Spirulina major]|uniref:hypothetical protein n=1 Tax=Spirulina major TaxID=270636 RepID=UPI0009350207|nr:hypothetical protein [Spirulina major]
MFGEYSVTVATIATGLIGWGAIAPPAAAVRLTGLSVFSAHGGGGITGERIWDTSAATPFWDAWLSPVGMAGEFLNEGGDRTLNYDLTPGTHEFQIFADPGWNYQPSWFPLMGLGLFFNDATDQPDITAMRLMHRAATDNPPDAIPVSGLMFNLDAPLGTTSGAGTLSAEWGTETVSLTEFQWFEATVWRRDRVSPHNPTPNGNPDQIGIFTLTVTDHSLPTSDPENTAQTPEGSTVLGLMAVGLLLCCQRRTSARSKHP